MYLISVVDGLSRPKSVLGPLVKALAKPARSLREACANLSWSSVRCSASLRILGAGCNSLKSKHVATECQNNALSHVSVPSTGRLRRQGSPNKRQHSSFKRSSRHICCFCFSFLFTFNFTSTPGRQCSGCFRRPSASFLSLQSKSRQLLLQGPSMRVSPSSARPTTLLVRSWVFVTDGHICRCCATPIVVSSSQSKWPNVSVLVNPVANSCPPFRPLLPVIRSIGISGYVCLSSSLF